MAKRSRARASGETPVQAQRPTRPARRRPIRRAPERSVLERYRTPLIAGVAAIGLLVIGLLFFGTTGRGAYECRSLLTPGPEEVVTPRPATPTAALSPSPAPTAEATGSPATSPSAPPSPSPTTAPASPDASPGSSPDASPGSTSEPSPSPEPSPTAQPTPAPEPTPRLGFPVADLDRVHGPSGSFVRYAYCPPASGTHYADRNAPLAPAVYQPVQEWPPAHWIHNLEHGYVAALYRCPSGILEQGDCVTRAEMAQLEAFFAQAPDPPISQCQEKVLVARFDQMESRFALVAWNRVLLVDQFDLDQALTFAEQWMEYDRAILPELTSC